MAKILGSISNDIIYTHLEIEHNADGTHKSTLLNFNVEHDTDGTHGAITPTSIVSSGAITGTSISAPTGNAIKWKIFDGTLDSDSLTSFTHGLTAGNILGASCSCHRASDDTYIFGDAGSTGWNAADTFRWFIDGTNGLFTFANVGTSLQGNAYRVIIFYI